MGTPTLASAQSTEGKQRAEAIYKEGLDLARAGKHEAALAKFEQSVGLYPTAHALFYIAKMENALGRHDHALFHFRRALREGPLTDEQRREAAFAIEELKTKASMIVFDVPAGAEVVLDGNRVDPGEAREVRPGKHEVKVTLGGQTQVHEVTCEAGKTAAVRARFDGSDGAASAPPSSSSTPPWTREPYAPPTSGESYWTTGHVFGVGLAGLAVAGIGVAVGFSLAREGHIATKDDLIARDPNVCAVRRTAACRELRLAEESADTASTIAIVSGATGLAAGIGAAMFLLWPRDSSSSTAAGRLNIAPTGRGLSVSGTF